jgi:hypothetical protein
MLEILCNNTGINTGINTGSSNICIEGDVERLETTFLPNLTPNPIYQSKAHFLYFHVESVLKGFGDPNRKNEIGR